MKRNNVLKATVKKRRRRRFGQFRKSEKNYCTGFLAKKKKARLITFHLEKRWTVHGKTPVSRQWTEKHKTNGESGVLVSGTT